MLGLERSQPWSRLQLQSQLQSSRKVLVCASPNLIIDLFPSKGGSKDTAQCIMMESVLNEGIRAQLGQWDWVLASFGGCAAGLGIEELCHCLTPALPRVLV